MEHQKIINLLDNTPNQPTKFRTKNDDSHGSLIQIFKLNLKLNAKIKFM